MRTLILLIAGWLMITNVWAEHEIDHRYIIRGYVLDENQRGISNLDVRVFTGSSLLANTKTDSAGYYSLHLHLHNADNRRMLKLHAGPNQAELRVTFDPTDRSTMRVHEFNFVGGEYQEGSLGRIRIPPWIYPVGGLLAIGVIVVFLEKRRKKKIKQKKTESIEKPSSSSRKAKKRRRKKR
ncbi:MAG: carboxypeptidase-like regulatory domain-containing protein [Gammaproteobacteria bacterium]|nr:carboxypeptidase-like regulatory domain-containing protein [Gammaproteobacteria bacterium]